MKTKRQIILASKSPSRAMILKNAGLAFEIRPSGVDEARIKRKTKKENLSPAEIGMILAREKALAVSKKNPGSIVIGADQILELGGEVFDKPQNLAEARETLLALRGKTHQLMSCVILANGGEVICEIRDTARLTMKRFSDDFLEAYLEQTGEDILSSVGAYQLEGRGALLFDKIEGDFFTILGLPLLKVLAALKEAGALDD